MTRAMVVVYVTCNDSGNGSRASMFQIVRVLLCPEVLGSLSSLAIAGEGV